MHPLNNPKDIMKTPTKKTVGPFTAAIQRAFETVHEQTGVTEGDLFHTGVAFSALGLIAVNVDFLPMSVHAVGWTAIFCGLAGMMFVRRIL